MTAGGVSTLMRRASSWPTFRVGTSRRRSCRWPQGGASARAAIGTTLRRSRGGSSGSSSLSICAAVRSGTPPSGGRFSRAWARRACGNGHPPIVISVPWRRKGSAGRLCRREHRQPGVLRPSALSIPAFACAHRAGKASSRPLQTRTMCARHVCRACRPRGADRSARRPRTRAFVPAGLPFHPGKGVARLAGASAGEPMSGTRSASSEKGVVSCPPLSRIRSANSCLKPGFQRGGCGDAPYGTYRGFSGLFWSRRACPDHAPGLPHSVIGAPWEHSHLH